MFEKLKKQLILENSDKSFLHKVWDNKIYRTSLGSIAGGILGFLYWKYIGCNTGSCPLTSNPVQSVLLFGFLGGFLAKDKKRKKG
ncbi:MAG: hypothetical protein HC831_02940 [Chloroflexia bacterium]|nr:hypothetical protein [Chloroflexia bacterium]